MLAPGPPKAELPKLQKEFRRSPLKVLERLSKKYERMFFLDLDKRPTYFLNDPEYIRMVLVSDNRNFGKAPGVAQMKRLVGEGLLTSEGEYHSWQRRLMQSSFSHEAVTSYADDMVHYTKLMMERWHGYSTGKPVLDIHDEMVHLTRSIVIKSLFGVDVGPGKLAGERSASYLGVSARLVLPFVGLSDRLQPGKHLPVAGRHNLDRLIEDIMAAYRASNPRDNLLSTLIEARDPKSGKQMTREQIRDEVATMLVAGHATTANALTWTWYLLSKNRSVEERLHHELDQVLEGRMPSLSDLKDLVYTKFVFDEAIRLYPSVWLIVRGAIRDCSIGNCDVPAGSTILISPYVTHRDKRFFSDPESFLPERWGPEQRESVQKFAYFPFGSGPRSCIGEHFARLEGVLIIAAVAQMYSMRLIQGYPVQCDPRPFELLEPKHGIIMRVEPRAA